MVLEYKVVAMLVWPQTRGIGSLHRAPPPALGSGEERRRSEVDPHGSFLWHCGYCLSGGCKGDAGLGRAKTSPRGKRKTVPVQILGCSCCDFEETSGSENETRLGAAGPPGPCSLRQRLGLPGVASTAMHALRRLLAMISSRCPTWRVKVRGLRQRTA
jgi:hypothetical protein